MIDPTNKFAVATSKTLPNGERVAANAAVFEFLGFPPDATVAINE